MNITVDERMLMSIYYEGDGRQGLLESLRKMRSHLTVEETELLSLTNESMDKLERMTDEEFDDLDLFPS